jgi:hydrogenase maturation protease
VGSVSGGARPIVIGLGTPDRSDDGAGPDVVRLLGSVPGFPADVAEGPQDLTRLLDAWEGRPLVVLVDAVRSGAAPGTVRRWERAEATRLPSGTPVSSHGLSLPDVLRLAERLGRLPPQLVLYGIEAETTGPGTARSAAVTAGVDAASRRIAAEVGAVRPGGEGGTDA